MGRELSVACLVVEEPKKKKKSHGFFCVLKLRLLAEVRLFSEKDSWCVGGLHYA